MIWANLGRSKIDALHITGYSNSDVYNGFPGVYINGCVVYNHEGKLISNTYFDKDTFFKIIDIFDGTGITNTCACYCEDSLLCAPGVKERFGQTTNMIGNFIEVYNYKDINDPKINQIMIMNVDNNQLELIRKYEGTLYKMYVSPSTVEILPLGVSKSTGIEALIKHYNGSFDDVVAIGDGINDVEMLNSVKHSYAMASGTKAAIEAAKNITKPNIEIAVAEVIKDVFGIE